MKEIKRKFKKKIDTFVIGRASAIIDCIVDCQPYEELEDCETVEEIKDWLENYQLNIDDAKQDLQDFNDILEELSNYLLKGE